MYIMGQCSAIKMNETPSFGTEWMQLKTIMFSGINHSQKDKYHMLSLNMLQLIQNNKMHRNEIVTLGYDCRI